MLTDAFEQLAGLFPFDGAHPGHRFVQQQAAGILDEQHPDLQPLLLAVRQHSGGRIHQSGQADRLECEFDLGGNGLAPAEQLAGLAAHSCSDVQVLQDAEFFDDAGGLEGAPDGRSDDLVRRHPEQLDPTEGGRSGRLGQAGDRVDQRGLSGTVGSDEKPQVARGDHQIHPVDRDEPVEGDPQILDLQVVPVKLAAGSGDGLLQGLKVGFWSHDYVLPTNWGVSMVSAALAGAGFFVRRYR
ncbi:hypothetical protein SDC9_156842 [bioreactor metagenome]|uniref:Uncharacterized protein n=1 Tax=bioreactor metagenome TaxID=1076179 RepID=A0A645F5L0_9ZZZZ